MSLAQHSVARSEGLQIEETEELLLLILQTTFPFSAGRKKNQNTYTKSVFYSCDAKPLVVLV
jgi:hypothetical protein